MQFAFAQMPLPKINVSVQVQDLLLQPPTITEYTPSAQLLHPESTALQAEQAQFPTPQRSVEQTPAPRVIIPVPPAPN